MKLTTREDYESAPNGTELVNWSGLKWLKVKRDKWVCGVSECTNEDMAGTPRTVVKSGRKS